MKIKCAAIRAVSGQIFEGRDHAVCFKLMEEAGLPTGRHSVCGFVIDTGEFVDRYEAAEIAYKSGQTKKLESPLFSEDLTGDWIWLKRQK